ncbi:MAG: hypothetical protein K8U57_13145 [Planctomycetes bacterium]|nr:hypothetical protein [Planctomycetota bacterium]
MFRSITDEDKVLLASYGRKCQEVSNFTLALIRGTHTGLMLFGAGGNGKSYSVRSTLARHGIQEIQPEQTQAEPDEEYDERAEEYGFDTWLNHQGRVTPKGLVKMMARYPNSLHLVEDSETLFDDKNAWGIFRMGLHSQDHSRHSKRRMTWIISTKDSYDFWFRGSLVIVGNRLLNDSMAEVEAVKTRCPCMAFDISNPELIAKMKEICSAGYRMPGAEFTLSKDECFDVLEFLLTAIEKDPALQHDARGKAKRLNFRILISGFKLAVLQKMEPAINWRDMLLSEMKNEVGTGTKRKRKDRVADEIEIANQIARRRWPNQHEKLLEYSRLVGRPIDWAEAPRDSATYKKGLEAAKKDFSRKK